VRLWPIEGVNRLEFLAKDLADGSLTTKSGMPTAYPLTCLLVLAPLAILPWPAAQLAWLVITVCLTLGAIWSLLEMGGFEKSNWRGYVFVAFALALAPLHTGLAAGSIVIGTVALCGIAVAREQRGSEVVAGILFGMATCLKPQIGLPFLVYYLLRRRWRLSGIAAGVAFAAAALAMARLGIGDTPWLQNYRIANKVMLATGVLSDFTERNPIRFSLINLQVLFYAIWRHAAAANVLALAISVALFGVWILLLLRSGSDDVLLPVATLAILSLFPVYHRFYDGFLLIFPLCWSLREFSAPHYKFARGAFLLMLPFLVPGGSALEQFQLRRQIPEAITHSWYWTRIAMPHQIWFLLLLSVLLLWRMAVRRTPDSP
jgi:hypothetical protein